MNHLYVGPATKENLNASIRRHVPYEIIERHFPTEDLNRLRELVPGKEGLQCWAMRGTKKFGKWFSEMRPADIVLLKENGPLVKTFGFQCEVLHKAESSTFGPAVWPKGDEWKRVFFFAEVEFVNINAAKLRRLLRHGAPTSTLYGLIRPAEGVMDQWIARYGSLRDFLNAVSSIDVDDADIDLDEQGPSEEAVEVVFVPERPEWLEPLFAHILSLRDGANHQERAHESLVETFYTKLGYKPHVDIVYQRGRIDILILHDGNPVIVNEVKRDWNLQRNKQEALKQAYGYAQSNGAKYVVVTNGDYYAFYDRDQGRSYDTQLMHELCISNLSSDDVVFLKSLKRGER